MANTYCTNCGYKNEYSIHPPKFCGGCGKPLGLSAAIKDAPKTRALKTSKAREIDQGDDFSDIDYVPEIRGGLKVDVDYGGSSRVIKGSDIIGEINELKQSGEEK